MSNFFIWKRCRHSKKLILWRVWIVKIKLVQIQYSDKRQNENHTGHTFSSCLMITVLTSRHILLGMSLVPVRAANNDVCSSFRVIEQWGLFFICHTYCGTGNPFYGHFLRIVTLSTVPELLTLLLIFTVFLTVAFGIRTHYFPNLFSSKPRD